MSNCNGCNKRVLSNSSCSCDDNICIDACVTPSCGDPKYLTVFAPVIYDQIGVNICRSIDVSGYAATYPGLTYVDFQPIEYAFTGTTPNPVISQIPTRPNCYEVTISNLEITFVVRIYDCCKRLLGTEVTAALLFLPASTDPNYNAETNPSSVTFEIFAPYGVSYTGVTDTPSLNTVGFSTTNNTIAQGLNFIVIPKVLNYDSASQGVNVGLSLILSSVYFSPYLLDHNGKAPVPKGDSSSETVSVCKKFVEGSLLDRNIKPLELGNPLDNKEACEDANLDPCDDNELTNIFD